MGSSGQGISKDVDMYDSLLYIILVQGALESSYSDRLSGMSITVLETADGPRTTLAGMLIDQAALQGVLKTLYDLGLPVLSVTSA
jgi:hypothetical protein